MFQDIGITISYMLPLQLLLATAGGVSICRCWEIRHKYCAHQHTCTDSDHPSPRLKTQGVSHQATRPSAWLNTNCCLDTGYNELSTGRAAIYVRPQTAAGTLGAVTPSSAQSEFVATCSTAAALDAAATCNDAYPTTVYWLKRREPKCCQPHG